MNLSSWAIQKEAVGQIWLINCSPLLPRLDHL